LRSFKGQEEEEKKQLIYLNIDKNDAFLYYQKKKYPYFQNLNHIEKKR